MKIYKNFFHFLRENENQSQDLENLESLENLEKKVAEFKSKKNILESIYKNNLNEKDLEAKLVNAKLVIKNNNGIAFINELLGIWAKIASKKKELQNVNDQIEGYKNNIIQKQQLIQKNPSLQESTNEEVKELNTNISNKYKDINTIKVEISKIETEVNNKLILINKKISNSK